MNGERDAEECGSEETDHCPKNGGPCSKASWTCGLDDCFSFLVETQRGSHPVQTNTVQKKKKAQFFESISLACIQHLTPSSPSAMSEKSSSEKLAHFQDKNDITKALDTTNSELLYTGMLLSECCARYLCDNGRGNKKLIR